MYSTLWQFVTVQVATSNITTLFLEIIGPNFHSHVTKKTLWVGNHMANLGYFDLYNLYITYHNISMYYHDSLHLVPIDDKKNQKFLQDQGFFVPMAPWLLQGARGWCQCA